MTENITEIIAAIFHSFGDEFQKGRSKWESCPQWWHMAVFVSVEDISKIFRFRLAAYNELKTHT